MVKNRKTLTILIFLYLILFPFGVLPGLVISSSLNIQTHLHPSDLIALAVMILGIYEGWKLPRVFKNFFWFVFFSIIFSLTIFTFEEIKTGVIYSIRLISYAYLIYSVSLLSKNTKEILKNALPFIGIYIGLFGWIQYLLLPDLTSLKYIGWDDHLFRLTSTFLDPAFTGILLVLSLIVSFNKKIKLSTTLIMALLLLSLAFTYSRSSFLALIFGGLYIMFKKKMSLKYIFFGIFSVFVILLMLPRPDGVGVKLERIHSVYLKAENFSDGMVLYSKSPIFGLGFNNLCVAKNKFLKNYSLGVHSCSGLDNSFQAILATTGIVGFLYFLYMMMYFYRETNSIEVRASMIAILVHSLFTNTLFYPWVIGWFGLLYGVYNFREYK